MPSSSTLSFSSFANFLIGLLLLVGGATLQASAVPFSQEQNAGASVSELEETIKNGEGLDKLLAQIELAERQLSVNDRKALKTAKQALSLSKNLLKAPKTSEEEKTLLRLRAKASLLLAEAQFQREDYKTADGQFIQAKTYARIAGDEESLERIDFYLTQIDSLEIAGEVKGSAFSEKFDNLRVGEKISGTIEDIKSVDDNLIEEIKKQESAEEKTARLNQLLEEEQADLSAQVALQDDTPKVRQQQKSLLELAESFEEKNDFEQSLSYYKRYTALTQRVREDSITQNNIRQNRTREITLLKQEKEIANLSLQAAEMEQAKQERQRNTSMWVAGLLLGLAILAAALYLRQRKQNAKISVAYTDLNKANEKLQSAEQNILNLLNQQLSGDIAHALLKDTGDKPTERRFVCIMFLDIRGFTPMAEKMEPEELIDFQNRVFGFMIDAVQNHHGNVNQFLGDGFMATFGAPVSSGNDCENALNAANEILKQIKKRSLAGVIRPIKVGIGLHAGHVVTGNVGTDIRKQYSITGNTVIIASRVEQLNKVYKSQLIITEEVFEKLEKGHGITERAEETAVKGRKEPIRIFKLA